MNGCSQKRIKHGVVEVPKVMHFIGRWVHVFDELTAQIRHRYIGHILHLAAKMAYLVPQAWIMLIQCFMVFIVLIKALASGCHILSHNVLAADSV